MTRTIRIESSIVNIRQVENAIDALTTEAGISQDNYGKILVATLEAVNNAIIHGNRMDKDKFVDIEISLKSGLLKVKVTDEGNGFTPSEIPDPTMPENIQAVNGRGVFLMSRLADKIEFNKRGNSVEMTFKRILP